MSWLKRAHALSPYYSLAIAPRRCTFNSRRMGILLEQAARLAEISHELFAPAGPGNTLNEKALSKDEVPQLRGAHDNELGAGELLRLLLFSPQLWARCCYNPGLRASKAASKVGYLLRESGSVSLKRTGVRVGPKSKGWRSKSRPLDKM